MRTSLLFSTVPPYTRNFPVNELLAGQHARLFVDETRSPTDAADLADALIALTERFRPGRYHWVGPVNADRYRLGLALAKRLGCDPRLLHAARHLDVDGLEPRPARLVLRSDRLAALVGRQPRPVFAPEELAVPPGE